MARPKRSDRPIAIHRPPWPPGHRRCLSQDLPVYAVDLANAARRDDGWLFHALASPLIKNAYVAWFAQDGYYLPFPKHLNQWVERFGLDQRRSQLGKEIWSAPTLTRRRYAIIQFAENILGT